MMAATDRGSALGMGKVRHAGGKDMIEVNAYRKRKLGNCTGSITLHSSLQKSFRPVFQGIRLGTEKKEDKTDQAGLST